MNTVKANATAQTTQVKTIDINAYSWFDKINGNSYFAGQVVINYGMDDEKTYYMPYQYGYGSQYEQEAREVLKHNGQLEEVKSMYELKQSGIIVRSNKQDNCKKAELKQFTELFHSNVKNGNQKP